MMQSQGVILDLSSCLSVELVFKNITRKVPRGERQGLMSLRKASLDYRPYPYTISTYFVLTISVGVDC